MIRYAKPASLDAALSLLGEGPWRLLAGGTDFYPALGNMPISENVLDLNGIASLRGICAHAAGVRIGARTTWTEIARAGLPPAFDALRQAAREVGSVQIQNMGTVAGNLCNASPAADGVPPLLALDAEVELASAQGARRLPLGDFVLSNRRTALAPGEMVTAIEVPASAVDGRSAFRKVGARRYLVISVAMAAVRLVVGNGRIASAIVAVGACSPVARRLTALEDTLAGLPATPAAILGAVAADPLAELAPIDDVRGTAAYRREAAREAVLRAVLAAAGLKSDGTLPEARSAA